MGRQLSILQFCWVLGITITLSLLSGYLFANAEVVENQAASGPRLSMSVNHPVEPATPQDFQRTSFLGSNDSPLSPVSTQEETHQVFFDNKNKPALRIQTGSLKDFDS